MSALIGFVESDLWDRTADSGSEAAKVVSCFVASITLLGPSANNTCQPKDACNTFDNTWTTKY